MDRDQVRRRITEIGIIPAIRVSSAEEALFAVEAVAAGGIPIVEITTTVPGALDVIAAVAKGNSDFIVGAGTVFDIEIAQKCLDAGASFLTSTGFDAEIVEFANKHKVAVFPGALTPTEIATAWRTGCDFVKIFPCAPMGGDKYIRSLKAPFPHVPLIAAGGVGQQTAADYILAGADALGIGRELIPHKAITHRQPHRIHELARRFVTIVHEARKVKAEG